MSQADVLNLVTLLSNGTADPNTPVNLYADIVNSWAAQRILTNAVTGETVTAGQFSYTLDTSQLSVLAFIYNGTQLGYLPLRELEALDYGWRLRKGRPRSYTTETETARTLDFYPTPAETGDIVVIGTQGRANVPVQFELPLALLILEREFLRESDHTDVEFAKLCGRMGNDLLTLAKGMLPDA